MRYLIFYICLLSHVVSASNTLGQDTTQERGSNKKRSYYQFYLDDNNSNIYILFIDRGNKDGITSRNSIEKKTEMELTKPLLTVHGNVMYDFNYYSAIDTPFYQKDVYQHTVQTYLDITIKDHYPLRLFFTTQFGNSCVFKDLTNVNLLFNNHYFQKDIKEMLKNKVRESVDAKFKMDSLKDALKLKYRELDGIGGRKTEADPLQRIVEARERLYLIKRKLSILKDSLNMKDSVYTMDELLSLNLEKPKAQTQSKEIDSLLNEIRNLIKIQNREDSLTQFLKDSRISYDSLKNEISALEKTYNLMKLQHNNDALVSEKEIDAIENYADLKQRIELLDMPDSILPKGYKTLAAIKSLGIGRSIVNYSELSVKNISLTGFNIEYNPSYYVAFAGGTINYLFRDFSLKNDVPRQYLYVVRAGKGMKDQNSIIFTYYAGKRYLNNSFADSATYSVQQPSAYLMGFTIEGNYQLGRNNTVTAEVAKSSFPRFTQGSNSKGLLSGLSQFNDHSNEAYSIKIASFIPQTSTSVTGSYKRFGINFQSFSIFNDGSSQSAVNLRIEQPLFKKTLNIIAALNSNDFVNPYITRGYKSSVVFKTVQAILRRKKWPVLSLGYYPSAQLTKLDNDQFVQNMFYTLVGNISHFYTIGNLMNATTFSYTQFYNNSSDTGFVYFNTKNFFLNHSLFLKKITLQFNASEAINSYYHLVEAGGNIQFKWNKWLRIGGGVKYNNQGSYNISHVGYSGNASCIVPGLGEFSFASSKDFIPGHNKRLVSNNTGRFTFYKTF